MQFYSFQIRTSVMKIMAGQSLLQQVIRKSSRHLEKYCNFVVQNNYLIIM